MGFGSFHFKEDKWRIITAGKIGLDTLGDRISEWLQPGRLSHPRVASLVGSIAVVTLLLFLLIPGQQKQTIVNYQYSPEEIQQATVEAKLALAYFSVHSRKAETELEKIDLNRPVIKPIEGEVRKALGKTNWNRKKAAGLLGISYKSLLNKIKKYRLASSGRDPIVPVRN